MQLRPWKMMLPATNRGADVVISVIAGCCCASRRRQEEGDVMMLKRRNGAGWDGDRKDAENEEKQAEGTLKKNKQCREKATG